MSELTTLQTDIATPQPASALRQTAGGPALVGVAALAAVTLIAHAADPLLDGPDPFWHWDVGRRMVSAMALVDADPYSFLTQGREWVLNQWGTEMVFGVADAIGGLWLVAFLAAVLAGTAVLTTGLVAWRRAPSLVVLALLGLTLVTLRTNWDLRGHLFTLVLLPLLLWELHRDDPRPLRLLIVLALWANLHGGFLVGILVVAAVAVGRWMGAAPGLRVPVARQGGRLVLAAVFGACLTPYGPPFLWHALTTGRDAATSGVSEWAAVSATEVQALPFTLLVASVLIGTAISARREDTAEVMLVVGFTMLGFSALRHTAVASVGLTVVGAPYVVAAYGHFQQRRPRGASPASRLDRAATILLLGAGLATSAVTLPPTSNPASHVDDLPLDLTAQLASADRPVRLFTTAEWAPGFAILGGSRVRTAIDARVELFTREEYAAMRTILGAAPGWDELLDAWCVTDVVVSEDRPLAEALARGTGYTRAGVEAMAGHGRPAVWYVRRNLGACPTES